QVHGSLQWNVGEPCRFSVFGRINPVIMRALVHAVTNREHRIPAQWVGAVRCRLRVPDRLFVAWQRHGLEIARQMLEAKTHCGVTACCPVVSNFMTNASRLTPVSAQIAHES